MQFRILGPFEVVASGGCIDLGSPRQRIVLAALVLQANRVVSCSRLVEAIYGDQAPSTSRAQSQICISALRRLVARNGDPGVIETRPAGYLLRIEAGDLDLHHYKYLVARARRAHDLRRHAEAARTYRGALRLWRGPPLGGIDSDVIRAAAGALDERRLVATEECIELELGLGRHRDLVAELTELTAAFPLRERLRGLLMLALHRSGRHAEALEVYRAARQTLVEELGLEPGEWLRRLEHGILTADPALSQPAAPAPVVAGGRSAAQVPCMLPTDISDFTGREEQVGAVERHFADAESPDRLAVPVVVLSGRPGVGKTALAVHVAHRIRERFPDGQLFLDLHGRSSQRVPTAQVLERFLRALGVPPDAIPEGVEERAELFRDQLTNRRVLVVLDDADTEAQVLPLLPGDRRSAVIVTSRSRLGAIPGAVHLTVDLFDPAQSIELLRRMLGTERVDAERDRAANLARLCGQLPLALRVCGARLLARPHWYLADLVNRLDDEKRRLDELAHAGMGIRASLSIAYDALRDDARRLLRLLAVVDFPWSSSWVAAALLDVPLAYAQDLLDELTDAQLVETVEARGGPDIRYRLHELIRVFARERLVAEETAAQRHAALERVLGTLLTLLYATHRRTEACTHLRLGGGVRRGPLPNQVADQVVTPARLWYEQERYTVVAAVRQAAHAGLVQMCWELAVAAGWTCEALPHVDQWREAHRIALAATGRAGDRRGEAAVLYASARLSTPERRMGGRHNPCRTVELSPRWATSRVARSAHATCPPCER